MLTQKNVFFVNINKYVENNNREIIMETKIENDIDFLFEVKYVFFEAVQNRSALLKKLENEIDNVKKNKKDTQSIKQINDILKKFTLIKNIHFNIKENLNNAYCITVYNDFFNKTLINYSKRNFHEKNKSMTVQETEIPKYIKRVELIFGRELLNQCNSQECVAIILHEIGHSFAHTTNIPNLFVIIRNKLDSILKKLTNVSIIPSIMLLTFLLSNISKSLSFFEHTSEYNADEFVVKYGYGDDLMNVLNKYRSTISKNNQSWVKQIINTFLQLFKSGSSHPSNEKRLCSMKQKMLDRYKDQYNPIKKELDIIYGKIQC